MSKADDIEHRVSGQSVEKDKDTVSREQTGKWQIVINQEQV